MMELVKAYKWSSAIFCIGLLLTPIGVGLLLTLPVALYWLFHYFRFLSKSTKDISLVEVIKADMEIGRARVEQDLELAKKLKEERLKKERNTNK